MVDRLHVRGRNLSKVLLANLLRNLIMSAYLYIAVLKSRHNIGVFP